MNTFLTNEETVNISIITIILYCIAVSLRHPISSNLILTFVLPLLYMPSMGINNVKFKKLVLFLLRIVYTLVSILIITASLFSGYIYQHDFMISLKTLIEYSPLIFGFIVLSLKSHVELKKHAK